MVLLLLTNVIWFGFLFLSSLSFEWDKSDEVPITPDEALRLAHWGMIYTILNATLTYFIVIQVWAASTKLHDGATNKPLLNKRPPQRTNDSS